MRHVEIAISSSDRRDIEQRLTGRFYTPIPIADRLAAEAVVAKPHPATVGDPFCGDGRLIVSWLAAVGRRANGVQRSLRRIVLWDYDENAVAVARKRVIAELSRLNFRCCEVQAIVCDTFERAQTSFRSLDLVLTNPPWELLKPDARDGMTAGVEYREELRSYADKLTHVYPGAASAKGKAMTGYGVNLARAGAVASVMLASNDGVIGIVLPSSIFADQASSPFRQEFYSRLRVTHIDSFPAEARLFEGVDQPFVTVIGRASDSTKNFVLRRFDKQLEEIETRRVVIDDPSRPLALTVGADHERIVGDLAQRHASLQMLEADMLYGLWLGRELDETRLSDYLTDAPGGVPFLKGKHVFPFHIHRDEVWRVDPKRRAVPPTVRHMRLAWRDVSRPTQRRRMHVALVPKGNVTGNSLGVAFFRYGPVERIGVLLALMNSMVFEIQVRTQLATAHVSQGILRKCTVPLRAFEDKRVTQHLLDLVQKRSHSSGDLPELEVEVAKAYNLDRESFASVLDAFPKLTQAERDAHLGSELWR
jgi:Alw26I/Eco31I/Esp3I family type II restriction m6 adenine DNA methyltransferase